MRTVFFGTPEMAVPALEALTQISEVVGVVCQPDRPAGRGMQLRPPPVKSWAKQQGLSVFQPVKVRDGQLQIWLAERHAEVAVVLAYGRILPAHVLRTPKHGCMNLHASLLPRHRGAAPIQWSLLAGDETTGISLMQIDEGLDTGPVCSCQAIPIQPSDDAGTLTQRLSLLAAEVIKRDLLRALRGELIFVPQDSASATHAPPISHADQDLSFSQSALLLARRIRAFSPKPGAVTKIRQRRLKLLLAEVAPEQAIGPPGTVMVRKRRILVATGDGTLEVLRLQFEGKSAQAASDIVNGRGILDGDRLGATS